VLFDELPVGDLRVLRTATGEQLGGRIARETVTAVGRLLRDAARRQCGGELRGALLAHRARGLRAYAFDQASELSRGNGVGIYAECVQFRGEECLRGGPEVALGHTEQLLRKRVQSSPEVASSDSA